MGSKAAAFRALAGNRALLRVVAAYALFTLTEYAVWIAMLVYAYAAAVVASTAVTATRPAQSTLIPSLAATLDQLTAANVAVSWVEAAGITAAGALTGLLIWLSGTAGVFAACAVPILGAALLLSGAIAATAAGAGLGGTLALLAVAGASRELLDHAATRAQADGIARRHLAADAARGRQDPVPVTERRRPAPPARGE